MQKCFLKSNTFFKLNFLIPGFSELKIVWQPFKTIISKIFTNIELVVLSDVINEISSLQFVEIVCGDCGLSSFLTNIVVKFVLNIVLFS